jgi:hypothetical protein
MAKLDVHFGGLCAFVPNRTPSSGSATSWSVLLLNLEDDFGEGQLDTLIAPHFCVLRYRLDHFDLFRDGEPEAPDLVLNRLGNDQNPRGIIQAQGKRIEMDLPGADPFAPRDLPLRDPSHGPQQGEAESIRWLPALDDLLPGAGTLAPQPVLKLFDDHGFPDRSRLSAHVLLRSGSLETSAFAPQGRQGVFNVWDFVTREMTPHIRDTRATAYRLTLRVSDLDQLSKIHVFDRFGNEVVLRQKVDGASCSILNYELEEVTGWARGNNVTPCTFDHDFDLAYWLGQRHRDRRRSLPRFKGDIGSTGLGTRRRTCALAQFSSFHDDDATLIGLWPKDFAGT